MRILGLVALSAALAATSISVYKRNLARDRFWLLAANLAHVNASAQTEFWRVVDNERLTKAQQLSLIGRWAAAQSPQIAVSCDFLFVALNSPPLEERI